MLDWYVNVYLKLVMPEVFVIWTLPFENRVKSKVTDDMFPEEANALHVYVISVSITPSRIPGTLFSFTTFTYEMNRKSSIKIRTAMAGWQK